MDKDSPKWEKRGQIYKHTFNATRTAWVLDFSPTVADPCEQKQTFQLCMKLSWSGYTVSVTGQNYIQNKIFNLGWYLTFLSPDPSYSWMLRARRQIEDQPRFCKKINLNLILTSFISNQLKLRHFAKFSAFQMHRLFRGIVYFKITTTI